MPDDADPKAGALSPAELRDLYERMTRALARRPALARGFGQSRVRSVTGLLCEVEGATGRLQSDAPPEEGGAGAGPTPAELMRAALGASLVSGCRLWAARLDVALADVTLELTVDFDARGALGLGARTPVGWQRVFVAFDVAGAAPADDLARVIDAAIAHDPLLASLSPAVERVVRLNVRTTRSDDDGTNRS